MYIIIEGIDKVGKSSLARYISSEFNVPIKKFSKPEGDVYLEYMKFLCGNPGITICDRFYLGELSYGPVKRGKSDLNPNEVMNIEMTLMARKPLLIYASTDTKTIKANFIKDKEEYVTIKDVVPLKQHFNQAIKNSLLNWYQFDYQTDGDYSKITPLIEHWFDNSQDDQPRIQKAVTNRLIGNIDASVLLVGDVGNVKLKERRSASVSVPFDFGKSSSYLKEALILAKVNPRDIAITNYTKHHLDYKSGIIDELNCLQNLKKVIFLGKVKQDLTLSTNLDVKSIKHPSWASRFNYPINKYAKELKELIYG